MNKRFGFVLTRRKRLRCAFLISCFRGSFLRFSQELSNQIAGFGHPQQWIEGIAPIIES
jgi:hypothetical protein